VQKDKFLVYAQSNGAAVAFIVLLGSTVALAYNAVHNMLLKKTSSVAVRPMAVSAHLWYTLLTHDVWAREGPCWKHSRHAAERLASCTCPAVSYKSVLLRGN